METFHDTIMRLDSEDNTPGLIDFLRHSSMEPGAISYALYVLLLHRRYKAAHLVAILFMNTGSFNPVASVALAVGSLLLWPGSDETKTLALLKVQIDGLGAQAQDNLSKGLIEPVVKHVTEIAMALGEQNLLRRATELLRAGSPRFRTIFDQAAIAPRLDEATRAAQAEAAKPGLIRHQSPPADAPRQRRRALVVLREHMFQPGSRLLDLGPRITAAMQNYGWDAEFYGMNYPMRDFLAIVPRCIDRGIEVLLLDDHMINNPDYRVGRAAMIAELKRALPNIKLIGLHIDSWEIDAQVIIAESAVLDAIWEASGPSLPVWRDPSFAGKMLIAPHPHGSDYPPPTQPLKPSLLFYGAVLSYNWTRALWLNAASQLSLPIERKISDHKSDGLSALESYKLYMADLAAGTAILSLSMRGSGARVVTWRCAEAITSGALLVQEATPDLDYFFTAGEHYLAFSTLAELREITRFISQEPDAAEAIRQRGNAYARAHYSDDKLIGYLDKILYYPGR